MKMKKMTKTSVSNTTTRLLALPPPNYMKSTASSDAKREQSKVSAKSPQTSSLHRKNSPILCLNSSSKSITATLLRKGTTHGNLQAQATCSSTLRGSKFPDYLKQNPPAAVKVCRYSYCSCNGNNLDALLPPLKCFVSARRRALKPQRCIKQRCQSPTPTGGGAEIIGREEQPVSTIGAEDVPGLWQNSHTCLDGDYEMEKQSGTCADIIPKSDDGIGCFFDEISVDEASQESLDEESFNSDALFVSNNWGNYLESLYKPLAPVLVPQAAATAVKDHSSFEGNQAPSLSPPSGDTTVCCNNPMNGDEHNLRDRSIPNEDATADIGNQASCKAIEPDQDHVEYECNQAESFNGVSTKDLTNELHTGDSGLNSNKGECIAVDKLSSRNTTIPETEATSSTQSTAKYRKSNQEYDDPRCFNPREVQLLPLEPEPEAEKVTLRHQQLDARKNADEWMVDYALRQAVTKVGNSSQRKVASIVEAIERVVPQGNINSATDAV